MTTAGTKEPLALFLQFSRSEFGDNAHLVPKEPLQYQRTDLTSGKVSTATFSWDNTCVKKGLAELRCEKPKASVLAELGGELNRFLRDCRVDRLLEEACAASKPIRITLRSAAAELYALPWELSRLEDAGKILAQLPQCTIRYTWPRDVPRAVVDDAVPQPEGGRILFAWSHGKEDDVPWKAHQNAIEAACLAMGDDKTGPRKVFDRDLDVVPHATFAEIYKKLEQAAADGRPYNIVHVLCHGGKLEDDEGFGLVLTHDDDRNRGLSDDGRSVEDVNDLEKTTVAPTTLATMFDGTAQNKPRLVVLCVCLGADSPEPGSHLGSVALAVHRTGIESVVASRFLLSKAGSILLTQTFYHSLLAGPTSIETAVGAARTKLGVEQTTAPDYAAIQLFQNTTGWDTRPVVFRPYRGLRHFQDTDAALFFGRKTEIKEACNDLAQLIKSGKPRLLIVMGASGTGKSSLVFAGIVPALQKARKAKNEPPWHVVKMRPRGGIEAVENACSSRGEKPLLLIIDQFEEIFTDIGDQATRNALVQKIWQVAGDERSGVTVIATLRVDYLARCGEVVLQDGRYLDTVANAEEHQVFVNRMRPDQLREVIEGPAAWAGLALGEGLVQQMVQDAGDEPGALPLMQVALEKLWEQRSRGPDGRDVLHLREYKNLARELTAKADGIIAGFADEPRKNAAKRLLVQLVDTRSDASPYTRRRMPKDELRKGPTGGEAVFDAVLEELTAACLVVVSKDERTGQGIVEIAHEQIVRSWDALRTWLKEDRQRLAEMAQFATWLEKAAAAATDTTEVYPPPGGEVPQEKGFFLRGGELALACKLREKYKDELRPEELALVESSEREAARRVEEERRQRAALEAALRQARTNALMSISREKIASGQPGLATQLLMEVPEPEKTRGWSQLVMDLLAGRKLGPVFTQRHDGEVITAAWSPDGQRIVTASRDQTVRVWRADGRGVPIVLASHKDGVNCAAWSPDGQRIVTAAKDHLLRVWTADGQGEPRVLAGHEGVVVSAVWSPNGEFIATASADKTVRVWRVDGTGESIVVGRHAGWVMSVAWSPDSQRVITTYSDEHNNDVETAHVWRADGTGEPLVLVGHEGGLTCAAWSPDGERILTASYDGTARVWRMDGTGGTGKPIVVARVEGGIMCAAWSPGGEHIVTAGGDGAVRVSNADGTSESLLYIGSHEGVIMSAAWSPDGQHIVTASRDNTARIWRADGMDAPFVLSGHQDMVRTAVWSPDGQHIVTVSDDKTARVWNTDVSSKPPVMTSPEGCVASATWSPEGRRVLVPDSKAMCVWSVDGTSEPVVLAGHQDSITCAAWSRDGRHIVAGLNSGTVLVWRADGSGEPLMLGCCKSGVIAVAWSPDGQCIAAASDGADNNVVVWRVDGTGEPVVLVGHQGTVRCIAWSADSQRIVTASDDQTARVWRADGTGVPLVLAGHESWVWVASWSPEGERILTASFDRTARVWRADGTGEPLVFAGHEDALRVAAWSPDGQRIVTGADDKTARVWRADGTGEPLVFAGHQGWLMSAEWSPDGQRIVTVCDNDKVARVWRADTTRELLSLAGHRSTVRTASWSPDSKRIVTASWDNTARVWSIDVQHLRQALRDSTTDGLTASERVTYLDESPEEARARYEAGERRYGRLAAGGV